MANDHEPRSPYSMPLLADDAMHATPVRKLAIRTPVQVDLMVASAVDVGDHEVGRNDTKEHVVVIQSPERRRPSREGDHASRRVKLHFSPERAGGHVADRSVRLHWPSADQTWSVTRESARHVAGQPAGSTACVGDARPEQRRRCLATIMCAHDDRVRCVSCAGAGAGAGARDLVLPDAGRDALKAVARARTLSSAMGGGTRRCARWTGTATKGRPRAEDVAMTDVMEDARARAVESY